MDVTVARERLSVGMDELKKTLDVKQKRERYFRGDHDRPFAPQGVNEEYIDLQDQAIANWIAWPWVPRCSVSAGTRSSPTSTMTSTSGCGGTCGRRTAWTPCRRCRTGT
jgi:hypothetical protein